MSDTIKRIISLWDEAESENIETKLIRMHPLDIEEAIAEIPEHDMGMYAPRIPGASLHVQGLPVFRDSDVDRGQITIEGTPAMGSTLEKSRWARWMEMRMDYLRGRDPFEGSTWLKEMSDGGD